LIKENNILFLYAELTPYLIGCLEYFSTHQKKYNIEVIYLKKFRNLQINPAALYKLISKDKFKSKHELLDFIQSKSPILLFISGRMDADYLFAAKKLKGKTIRISLQDTQFNGGLKQYFIKILSFYFYKRYFDKFWGIGSPQYRFAKFIGFKDNDIRLGFYVADKKFFDYSKKYSYDLKDLNILFIGRLVKEKNIIRLLKAVEALNIDENANHKVSIIGEGYLRDKIKSYNCVDYFGLKNQNEIIKIAKRCDVFCLPSIYEPWGVVIHEMAALGLPILSSIKCGASSDLVEDNYNGFKFNPHSISEIKKSIIKFNNISNLNKNQFSSNSLRISKKINHELWNKNLISFIKI